MRTMPERELGTLVHDNAPGAAPVVPGPLSRRPSVSVVVPVFNGEAYLREALDSILGQRYAPFEVILMDDGSTDSTAAIAGSYEERLRYVRQPENRGQFGNVNDGIALARGELIGVFHADDVYTPELIEREVAWLAAHPTAGAVFSSDIFIDAGGREFGRLVLPAEIRGGQPLGYAAILNALLMHGNTFLRCPTALVRASVYREVGFYQDERGAEFENTSDLEMWLRIARRYHVGVLEEHLLRYRRGHGSASERYHHIRTEPFRFFQIIDAELDGFGRNVATPEALRAYEAHRNVDHVLRAVNQYILGDLSAARGVVDQVPLRALAGSSAIQRGRMIALVLALRLLTRLPRSTAVARLFERRWHRARDEVRAD